jgi:hypothetical protein
MPIPVWPATLPQVALREGYDVRPEDDMIIKRDMEDGLPLQRRKKLSSWTPVNFRLILTPAQWATLTAFYRNDLNFGANKFTMPVWNFSGVTVSKTVQPRGPMPTPSHIAPTQVGVSISIAVRDFYL